MKVAMKILLIVSIIIWSPLKGTELKAQPVFQVEKCGSGTPVILIPGLISGGEVWNQTVDSLQQGFECHVLTLAGFAGVDPLESGPYLKTYRDAIIEYIHEHDLDNVQLVGHSLGGFLSLLIGLENISEVDQILIVDALPFFQATFRPDAKEGFDTAQVLAYMNSLESQHPSELENMRRMVAKSMSMDSTYWDNMVEWAMTSDLRTEAFALFEMMGWDLRDDLLEIKCPVHVFVPYHEPSMNSQMDKHTVVQLYEDQYSLLDKKELEVIENAGHFIMLDQPESFIGSLEKCLSKL